MLCILSPSKTLRLRDRALPASRPAFATEAARLNAILRALPPEKLQAMLGVSGKLAEQTIAWIEAFAEESAEERPAVMAFAGETFRGLDADAMSDEDLAFAQDKLAILSGMYGVLRPLDAIRPYRLDVADRVKVPPQGDLYAFWGERVTRWINAQTASHADRTTINLASQEYSQLLRLDLLESPVITPVFKEQKAGRLQLISTFAKQARGAMAAFAVRERLESPAGLRAFTGMGYAWREELSTASDWVFTR